MAEKVLPDVVFSHDADGVVIAWNTCGECSQHIRVCNCPAGFKEPAYIQKIRDAATREEGVKSYNQERSGYGVGK